MSSFLLLVTDRETFERNCQFVFQRVGLPIRTIRVDELSDHLAEDSVVLIDAGSEMFDEDELLSSVGLARALNAVVAVVLPKEGAMNGIQDVLDDLCPGLVARGQREITRIAGRLSRFYDENGPQRFEYVTVSPRPNELLVILGNATSILVRRPIAQNDDGSDVLSISLSEDAKTATLSLASGNEFTLMASSITDFQRQRDGEAKTDTTSVRKAKESPKLGARLKSLRQAAGLTQAELARRTGIHRPNIARVEAGRHTPSLETLTRLAAAIGVTTTTIFTDE
jgi:DNA-binding XRE family transcriptional regulator